MSDYERLIAASRGVEHQSDWPDAPLPEGDAFSGMKSSLLKERATDWIGHKYHERLIACAEALFVHGYIARSDADRIINRVHRDLGEGS